MKQATINLPLGNATLSVPAEEAARILIEKFLHEPAARSDSKLPRIGEAWPGQGGIYAGLMRAEHDAPDYHLVVPTDPASNVQEIAWGGYDHDEPDAKSDFDGLANTLALCESERDHPAAKWAAGLVIDGHADFYLPARRELSLCYANVPELFDKEWHWSSTQSSRDTAYGQTFTNGTQYGYGKDSILRARAVRRLVNSAI
ncbi:DUF1566 domain-containing protein [Chromobacterium haemolyticum]|uniref:DUF1566 domain-containing protein n=1 Tax=Chromobacterium haemolyticum TaxID=394935 RepID=UPI001318A895|nr:DUF1566 domain-containing protein [Chromobacterium haemolyticum]BBH11774.1 hypothetical protein CH06BL_10220 [Chromobacterium haemolyticum]